MFIRNFLILILACGILLSCNKEISDNSGIIAASTQLNASYGAQSLQTMDVYLPAGRSIATTKVMILVHGGAWSVGDKADFTVFVDSIKKRLPDYAIFNINYRLAAFPNNLFPTQEQDVKTAVEYIYSKRNDYLISDKIVLTGASAGAHLSLLQAYKYNSPVKIKAVIDFFGPTDITDLYNNPGVVPQQNIAAIMGGTPASNAALYLQSSPISFVSNTTACPTLILQGSADPLVNSERQSAVLRDKLEAASVPVEYVLYAGKGHGDDWGSDTFFDAFSKMQVFVALHNP
jgi:acetyl esterase/lipase